MEKSKDENFDRDAFIDEIELAIDYGQPISQENYDLYKACVAERAEEEAIAEGADVDMDM